MTENAHWYQNEQMPSTAGGREVCEIDGEPGVISRRAGDIEALGEKMARAARTLELFADGTVGKGKSFEAIREQAKEVHEDLAVAAQRYTPSGEALATYATALRTVQSSTGWRVRGAERTWEEVRSASRALSAAEGDQWQWDFNDNHDVEQSGTRPSADTEQAAFDEAVADWESYWSGYDAPVETWEGAYNAACTSLEKVNEDGVSDSFWDNSMPFVEAMLTVLMVVGIVLLVVAFVVTGPLAMLAGVLAVVAGVLSLLGEIAKLNAGRGDWGSVALAAVGIIPFGKLAQLGKLADFAEVGARFPKLSGAFRLGGDEFLTFNRTLNTFLESKIPNLFTQHGLNSQNLMRGLYMPRFLTQGNAWVGSWRGGWNALAGNPTNVAEAIGGSADAYVSIISSLKDLNERFATAR